MRTFKKYLREGLIAVTALGTAFFYALLVLFLISIKEYRLAKHIFIGIIACYAFVAVLRIFYFKERPEKEDYFNLFTRINASSFPSLHTMSSMFIAIVLANAIRKPTASIFLVALSLLIGYSRIYLKKHYLIDVVFGLILGVIASIIYLSLVSFS